MTVTFAGELAQILQSSQCNKAFGVSGGYIFSLWHALASTKSIDVYHCRSEAGSAYAAAEDSLHRNAIGVAFATSGPGPLNAYAALRNARADGAKVIFLSAVTADSEHGPKKAQETTPEAVFSGEGESLQHPFSQCLIIRDRNDLIRLQQCIQALQASHGGCLGVFIAPQTQRSIVTPLLKYGVEEESQSTTLDDTSQWIEYLEKRLAAGSVVLWVGSGVKHASRHLLSVVEHYQVPVISTSRAKGVFPETHPLFWGCTGIGGSMDPETLLRKASDGSIIVLGTRLEEVSTSTMPLDWKQRDIAVFNSPAHEAQRNLPPHARVIDVDIITLLEGLAQNIEQRPPRSYALFSYSIPKVASTGDRLHPVNVLSAVQDLAMEKNEYLVMGDIGNTLSWVTRYLRFNKPGHLRLSSHDAPMSYATCGAIGIAASGKPVLVITGDGAMLLQNEISTAVRYHMPIIWVVMNDGTYNMCQQVWNVPDAEPPDCAIPDVDFALYAKALGADGFTVRSYMELDDALDQAIWPKSPTVIDAKIDGTVEAPVAGRKNSLAIH